MTEYYTEVPELTYSIDLLLRDMNTIINDFRIYQPFPDQETPPHLRYYENRSEAILEQPETKRISETINPELKVSKGRCVFLKFPKGYQLPIHTDINRLCALHFPLSLDDTPIQFFNKDGDQLGEHVYKCATLINVIEPHNVKVSPKDRYAFQISFYKPYSYVRRLIEDGKFLGK